MAKCMHLSLPCEEHQDATCRENQASQLPVLSLQALAVRLDKSGARPRELGSGWVEAKYVSRVVRGT